MKQKAEITLKQWIAFWMLGLIWGSSFLLIKIAVEELGIFPLVAIRVTLGASLMLLYLWWAKKPMPRLRADWIGIIFIGVFNVALPFTLITAAEERIDSSLATILNSTVPLFSLIIAHFFLRDERLNRYKIAGLVIGYFGVLILTWRGINHAGSEFVIGILMMLLGAASYAVAVVYMRARMRHIGPFVIAGWSLFVGAVCILPLTFIVGDLPQISGLSPDVIFSILTLGTVNTVIAYFLFYHLISEWGARATTVTYVFPPVGIMLGAVFLGELIDERLILGGALILAGVVAVNYKPKRARQLPPPPTLSNLPDPQPQTPN